MGFSDTTSMHDTPSMSLAQAIDPQETVAVSEQVGIGIDNDAIVVQLGWQLAPYPLQPID